MPASVVRVGSEGAHVTCRLDITRRNGDVLVASATYSADVGGYNEHADFDTVHVPLRARAEARAALHDWPRQFAVQLQRDTPECQYRTPEERVVLRTAMLLDGEDPDDVDEYYVDPLKVHDAVVLWNMQLEAALEAQ